jgi:hypothetical protein
LGKNGGNLALERRSVVFVRAKVASNSDPSDTLVATRKTTKKQSKGKRIPANVIRSLCRSDDQSPTAEPLDLHTVTSFFSAVYFDPLVKELDLLDFLGGKLDP